MTGFEGFQTRTVSAEEWQRIKDEENPHLAQHRRHGLAVLKPYQGRTSFTQDELPRVREALKTFGHLLPDDERLRMQNATREAFVVHRPEPPAAPPAPAPADVARALRKLADRVEQGDPEAARRIVAAARD